MNRRSFLTTLACALPAAMWGARPAALAAVTAACRPTASEPGPLHPLDRLGVQLYTVRTEMESDVGATLAQVAAIGYREVEFAGYFGRTPAEIRALLHANGLAAPSTHVEFSDLNDNWNATLASATTIGHRFMTIPWIPVEERQNLDDWKRIAELFNLRAAESQQSGLRFAYHNHDFEFVPVGGRIPLDVLLEETDPSLVEFEMDVYWVTKGGQDPVSYLDRFRGRFPMLHLKDSAGPPDHDMTDVGGGIVDFPRILELSVETGGVHFFVEHDHPPDPLASIRASYDYLAGLRASSVRSRTH